MKIAIKRDDGQVSIMEHIDGELETAISQWETASGFKAVLYHPVDELPDRATRHLWDTDGQKVFVRSE